MQIQSKVITPVALGAFFGIVIALFCSMPFSGVLMFALYGTLMGQLAYFFKTNIVSFDFGQLRKRDEAPRPEVKGPYSSVVAKEGDVLLAAPTKTLAILCAIPMACFFFAIMVLIIRSSRIVE